MGVRKIDRERKRERKRKREWGRKVGRGEGVGRKKEGVREEQFNKCWPESQQWMCEVEG